MDGLREEKERALKRLSELDPGSMEYMNAAMALSALSGIEDCPEKARARTGRVLGPAEVGERLGLSAQSVRGLMRAGSLPCDIATGKRAIKRKVTEGTLDKFLASRAGRTLGRCRTT